MGEDVLGEREQRGQRAEQSQPGVLKHAGGHPCAAAHEASTGRGTGQAAAVATWQSRILTLTVSKLDEK